MSQILRIHGKVLHIPSIARTRLYDSPILSRPIIKIVTHSGEEEYIRYRLRQWDIALKDYKQLECTRALCYEALKHIPILEEPSSELVPLK